MPKVILVRKQFKPRVGGREGAKGANGQRETQLGSKGGVDLSLYGRENDG